VTCELHPALDSLFLSRYRACCPCDVLRAVFTLR